MRELRFFKSTLTCSLSLLTDLLKWSRFVSSAKIVVYSGSLSLKIYAMERDLYKQTKLAKNIRIET